MMSAVEESPVEPSEVIRACPICGGMLELVYDRPHTKVSACVDCQSEIAVPPSAWTVARNKQGLPRP